MRYKVLKSKDNFHVFEMNTKEWGMGIQHMSDIHIDNPKCNRSAFIEHLKEAVAMDYGIVITGDLLCLMNGKYDPRRSKSGIRNEYNEDNYLDLVIHDTARILEPYAHNILMISTGNHESSVSVKNGTNVLERVIDRINQRTGSNIVRGAYMGYYVLNLKHNGAATMVTIAYDHGHWGGIISKGAQSAMRYAAIFPEADLCHSGHTHDSFLLPIPMYSSNKAKGKVLIRNKWIIRTGTYKEEFEKGEGWATEKIGVPKFIGCARTKIMVARKEKDGQREIKKKFETTLVEAW